MDSQKPKIALYAKRPFGEKLNASFDFIKENWKPLLKFTTYLMLPLSLIQALSLNALIGGMDVAKMAMASPASNPFGQLGMAYFIHYGIYMLVFVIAMIVMTSLIYGMVQLYNSREERLQNITFKDLKPVLFRNMKRMVILILGMAGLMLCLGVLMGVLSILSLFTLILTIPLLFAISVPLALWIPIYLFEDISFSASFKKMIRLGFATWGGVFLIGLVMGFISYVLQGVTTIPWYVAFVVKVFFSMSDTGGAATVSPAYGFILYLLAIVQAFGGYLSMIFSIIGMAYQYGHASEVVDSITVESDIENFDKL